LNNIGQYEVWEECSPIENIKPLNCTWVFKTKKNELNEVVEYKSRLCVQGFAQIEGQDYSSTFAPTGKLTSFRMLIVFALKNKLKFEQVDVKSAFLNATLDETVLINPPQGVKTSSNKVLWLKKALYGLKQAPQAWYNTLSTWLFSVGFHRCEAV